MTLTVCARDAEDWVEGCLDALFAQSHRPIEIIAVNDGSRDRTSEAMHAWAGAHESETVRIEIIDQPPLGLSAGRQAAVDRAKGEWVAITDIDCRPQAIWIEAMLEASIGMQGEDVMAVTGRTRFLVGKDLPSKVRSEQIERKYGSRSRRATLANGPCSMFLAEALVAIGGFDPTWYHAEDMEVSLRLLSAGGTIVYAPTAVVEHLPEEGYRRFLRKRRRDARAHLRIIHHFGWGGPRRANAPRLRHDFTSDALGAAFVAPLLGGACAVASLFGPLWVASPLVPVLLLPRWRLNLCWSLALWVGATEGCIDWLLGRQGHGHGQRSG